MLQLDASRKVLGMELMKIIAAMETVRPLLQANPAPSLETQNSGNGSGLVS
jgi:hypothetical protein